MLTLLELLRRHNIHPPPENTPPEDAPPSESSKAGERPHRERTSKRQRMEGISQNSDRLHVEYTPINGHSIETAQENPLAPKPCTEPIFDEKGHQTAWPHAKALPAVFPPDLCYRLYKNKDNQAAIMVSFPRDTSKTCLYLYVRGDQVQDMAKELYNIRIDAVNNQRYIIHDNGGASQKIQGSVRFSRMRPDIVEKIFGSYSSFGISNSMRRCEEIARGEPLTDCVHMKISDRADAPARFKLILSADQLSVIKNYLWQ